MFTSGMNLYVAFLDHVMLINLLRAANVYRRSS